MSRISASLKAYAKTTVAAIFEKNLIVEGKELFLGSGDWSNPVIRFWDKNAATFRAFYYNTEKQHFAVQTPKGSGFLAHSGLWGDKIGQYVFARRMDGALVQMNWTVKGSKLKPASGDADTQDVVLSGTYRCLGFIEAAETQAYGSTATLWQRIA